MWLESRSQPMNLDLRAQFWACCVHRYPSIPTDSAMLQYQATMAQASLRRHIPVR